MRFLVKRVRSLHAWIGAVAIVALVAACGGGSSHDVFQPSRLVAFGDENSVIDDSGTCTVGGARNGCKYTINAVQAANPAVVDCTSNPIWVQLVAQMYGFVFSQCNPNGVATPQALTLAANGATVTDLSTQIDNFLSMHTFVGSDLVTILVGQNDIMAQYAVYAGGTQTQAEVDAITATLTTAGEAVAAQVNRVAQLGGKVIIATVPDMGTTPFGVDVANTIPIAPATRSAVLTEFTNTFNSALRVKLAELNNDGHMIGLVLSDEVSRNMVLNPNLYGLVNVIGAACVVALPICTTNTPDLQAGAAATTWLWADSQHLSPNGHARLGAAAQTRAQNNPF